MKIFKSVIFLSLLFLATYACATYAKTYIINGDIQEVGGQDEMFGASPVLRVNQGGTGATSFTLGECLYGNGTGAIYSGACSAGSMTALPDTQIYVGNASNQATATSSVTVNSAGVLTASGGNSSQWTTAYGWGNHASSGYLTSYTETDPVWIASSSSYLLSTTALTLFDVLGQATSTLASHTTTYNHANYDAIVASSTFYNTNSNIVNSNYSNWNSAYSWGNHEDVGYITGVNYIGDIGDVSTASIANGDMLVRVGSYWINKATSTLGLISLSDLSSSALGLTYSNSTGVFSLTAGYEIATSTRLALHDTAYNWGDHTLGGYLSALNYNATTTHATMANMPSLVRPFAFGGISTSTQDVNGNFLVAGATSTIELIRVPYPMTISETGYDVTAGTAGLNIGDCTNYMGYKAVTTTFASSTASTNNTYTQGETLCAAVNLSAANTLLFITGLLTTD